MRWVSLAYGHQVGSGFWAQNHLAVPPSLTQCSFLYQLTAAETIRVCNTNRRAPLPRFSKPLWNSNEAFFLSNPPLLGIHFFFFPAPKVSYLLSLWNHIYCGPHKPALPMNCSNIFCLLLINCSSLCTVKKKTKLKGIISQVLFL